VNIYEELQWRGLIADSTAPILFLAEENPQAAERKRTLYCGFDPTADSLHVGNLVPLLALRRFQVLGHHPIAVAGGATGSIGDPSGKTNERQLLTREILDHNIASVKVQLAKLLEFDAAKTPNNNPAYLLDNASWTKDISFLDFLRDIGKYFSVNQMVAKESVRARMEDREVGISYTEFSYMLLQAFDFMVLARNRNCELQIGGSDQWGNITAGIELTRKKLGKQVFGLTLPLITNADGTKFGKTEAGAIWLDPKKTLEHDFYHFWINTDDRDVIRYLKYFTFLTQDEIETLEKAHTEKPGERVAHKTLAKAVTDLIHGSDTTQKIIKASNSVFAGKNLELSREKLVEARRELPGPEFDPAKIGIDPTIPINKPLQDVVYFSGLSASKTEARRLIEQGGISVNYHKESDPFRSITVEDYLCSQYLIIQKGKKTFSMISGSAPIPNTLTQLPPPSID
jgi:tyrosyl-tRNA synthetase